MLVGIILVTFAGIKDDKKAGMRRYKVSEVMKLLEADGWRLSYTVGDHRQYKHPVKKGKVTVRGHKSDVLSQFLLNSIWHQAGWK